MSLRWTLLLSSAMALAACDPAATQPAPAETQEAPMPVEPDGGIGDGAEPLDELLAQSENAIPERFHGVWDYVEGSCAPESDMRLEVRADSVQYYESVGEVSAVSNEGESLLVTLKMEGEGETWEQVSRFTLSVDGETLEAAPEDVDPMPRKRCAS